MDLKPYIIDIVKKAKVASFEIARIDTATKNNALIETAIELEKRTQEIMSENAKDIAVGVEKGLSSAMIDRLKIDEAMVNKMANVLREVVTLADPVGEITDMIVRPSGIKVGKMRVPIGVICIIYESRPNVTIDAASLCIKSGNAVILRGGSEAINSNKILASIMSQVCSQAGLPSDCIQIISTTDRNAIKELLIQDKYIDLVIPRGGKGLIKTVVENSKVPVIKHYDGNCHLYVDKDADLKMAEDVAINAKTQRPGVCNAIETLLVHSDIADKYLRSLLPKLKEKSVEIRGCERALKIDSKIFAATEDDWYKEYLDLILAVKIVDNIEDAIAHIAKYGSNHTDAIVTENYTSAMKFLQEVNSSCVLVNASTRFSDGGEFGMGCEIGISTDKLHARGPMGLKELTTQKFIVFGSGQIRTSK